MQSGLYSTSAIAPSASLIFLCTLNRSRSPDISGQNGRRSCLAVDHADLQNGLDVPARKIASYSVSKKLHVVGAGRKLSSGLGPVAAHSSQHDHPTIGCGIAKPGHQRIVVRAGVGE